MRLAIVGTGPMARIMAADIRLVPSIDLVAVVSRSADTGRRFGDEIGVGPALALEDLDRSTVDLAYVATSHESHAPIATRLLEAGIGVLLEKAFTLDAAEARALQRSASDNGLFLMEAMWMRFNPAIRAAVSAIAEGAIGEPRQLQASFGRAVPSDTGHRLWAPGPGGGSLLDQWVYPATLADEIFGEPSRVSVEGSTLGYDGRSAGIVTEASVLLGYGDGRQATLSSSIRAALDGSATIAGSEGTVRIESPFWAATRWSVSRPGRDPEVFDAPRVGGGYTPMLEAVTAAVERGELEHPLCPVSASIRMMSLLDRVRDAITAPSK